MHTGVFRFTSGGQNTFIVPRESTNHVNRGAKEGNGEEEGGWDEEERTLDVELYSLWIT